MRIRPPIRPTIGLALSIGFVLAVAPAVAAAPSHDWTRQFGSTQDDYATGVAVDRAGNSIVVGFTYGALKKGAKKGGQDAFVRKYRPNGRALWTRQFGTTKHDGILGVAVDGAGNIVVGGYTYGSLDGGRSRAGLDAFVRKYRPNGRHLWTRQFGSTSDDEILEVAVSRSGSIFVTGYTEGSIGRSASRGGSDAFLRKYRADGTVAWTRQFGSPGNEFGRGVAVDRANNIVVAGSTTGSLGGLRSLGGPDAFVRKYRPNGAKVWTRQFGTVAEDFADAVAVGPQGNIYAAGRTWGAMTSKPAHARNDSFVRKLRPNGRHAWTRQYGTAGEDSASDVATDTVGRVYLAGSRGVASLDAYVRKLKANGTSVWFRRFGDPAVWDVAVGVATDRFGNIVLSGTTKGTLAGQQSRGKIDAFVRKYRPPRA